MLPNYHVKTHFKAAQSIFLRHKGSLQAEPGELEKNFMLGENQKNDSLQ
jgi:hypothetical protein